MITDGISSRPLTALVLAASRQGIDDPVARLQNKSHKCLVAVDGIAMIERVIQTLQRTGGNVLRASRLLGLSREKLRYRIKKYEVRHLIPDD